jgi:hypothetical protein
MIVAIFECENLGALRAQPGVFHGVAIRRGVPSEMGTPKAEKIALADFAEGDRAFGVGTVGKHRKPQ